MARMRLLTFQVPISRPRTQVGGFTFLEVMVSLLICTVLISAVSSSLYTVLEAEQLSTRLRTSALALRTLHCRYALQSVERSKLGASFEPDWILSQHEQRPEEGMAWIRLSLAADESSPVALPLALHADLSEWQ